MVFILFLIRGISINGTETNSIIIIGNVHEMATSLHIFAGGCARVYITNENLGGQRVAGMEWTSIILNGFIN